jgi:hypothetical protein
MVKEKINMMKILKEGDYFQFNSGYFCDKIIYKVIYADKNAIRINNLIGEYCGTLKNTLSGRELLSENQVKNLCKIKHSPTIIPSHLNRINIWIEK